MNGEEKSFTNKQVGILEKWMEMFIYWLFKKIVDVDLFYNEEECLTLNMEILKEYGRSEERK